MNLSANTIEFLKSVVSTNDFIDPNKQYYADLMEGDIVVISDDKGRPVLYLPFLVFEELKDYKDG